MNEIDSIVKDRLLAIDHKILLIRRVGSIAEGVARPDADHDYAVISPSISFEFPDQQHEGRKIQVFWFNVFRYIGLDYFCDTDPLDHFNYPHYTLWYNLLATPQPVYVSSKGQKLIDNAHLFVNRRIAQSALTSITNTHNVLMDVYPWEGHFYKHAKANLIGLDMVEKACNGELTEYDITQCLQLPKVGLKKKRLYYYDQYAEILPRIDITKIPPENVQDIRDLKKEIY